MLVKSEDARFVASNVVVVVVVVEDEKSYDIHVAVHVHDHVSVHDHAGPKKREGSMGSRRGVRGHALPRFAFRRVSRRRASHEKRTMPTVSHVKSRMLGLL